MLLAFITMAALRIADADIIFCSCGSFLLISSFFLALLSVRRLNVYHTTTHDVAVVRI